MSPWSVRMVRWWKTTKWSWLAPVTNQPSTSLAGKECVERTEEYWLQNWVYALFLLATLYTSWTVWRLLGVAFFTSCSINWPILLSFFGQNDRIAFAINPISMSCFEMFPRLFVEFNPRCKVEKVSEQVSRFSFSVNIFWKISSSEWPITLALCVWSTSWRSFMFKSFGADVTTGSKTIMELELIAELVELSL